MDAYVFNSFQDDGYLLSNDVNLNQFLLTSTIEVPISTPINTCYQDNPSLPTLNIPSLHNAEHFDLEGQSDLMSVLNSVSSYNRQEKIIELEKEHSWEKVILLYKPLTADNNELKKDMQARSNIANYLIYYKNTLLKLINYRLDREDVDLEKWNTAIEQNKTLLYQRLKSVNDRFKNPNTHHNKGILLKLSNFQSFLREPAFKTVMFSN
uniref:MatS protein n=1 Tax=Dictyostelium discoideum TaxID=44689 RepID=D3UFE0_DICDI|nr:matS protein [Dictyostelium discoideum]